jgi:general secretion pathway protein B
MSILLDALKKSERQRQLGQTPTLETPSEGGLSSQESLNHWIPISLVVLSACVMAWFGWQQFRQPESGYAPESAADVVEIREEPQPRTRTEKFKPDGNKETARAARPPVAVKDDDSDRARLNQSFNEFTAENRATITAEQAGDSAIAAERLSQAAAGLQAANAVPGQPGAGPGQARAVSRQPGAVPGQAGAEPEKPGAEPGQSRLQPHISEPISYWELPQGVRDNLPELKITVLVYAEEPDDRFLLTNGQRLAEKDELQTGLVLDEIRRDGAIFLYRNYRFLVKG